MNKEKIAIITDSGTNVPPAFIKHYDIRVLPLQITYQKKSYQSGVDITPEEVISRLDTEIPTTSLPSPLSIKEALAQCKTDGYEKGIIVTISSGLSATFQTCKLVASQMKDFPCAVIDTKSIGVAAGMTVMNAALMAEAGATPFEEMPTRLETLAEDTLVLFAVQSLDLLRRGGRITEAQYRLGSILNIKPILTCNKNGVYETVKKVRGWEKTVSAMQHLIAEKAKEFAEVVVAYCAAEKTAPMREWGKKLKKLIPTCKGLIMSGVTPDLLVHTGPSLIGFSVQPLTPEMQEYLAKQKGLVDGFSGLFREN